jgi:hypothetical protein
LAEARLFGGLIRRKQGARCSDDEFAAESTLFSLSLRVPQPSERRTDERLLAILPVVKLVTPGGAVLCRIKNISAGGIAAEVTGPVASDTAVEIEFSSDRRIPGTVVWTREGSAGIKFDAEIDLRQLLAARKPREGYRARPPRLEVSCPATVRLGGMFHQVEIRDISLGGLKVAINDWSCVGKPVTIAIDSLTPVKGRVRWYKAGQAGIVFDQPLRFEELAEWLGKRLEIATFKTGAWDKGRR